MTTSYTVPTTLTPANASTVLAWAKRYGTTTTTGVVLVTQRPTVAHVNTVVTYPAAQTK